MKKHLFLIILGLLFFKGYTQDEPETESGTETKNKKNALAISAGSPGFGIQYARKLSPKFNIIAAYHFFNIDDYERPLTISGEPVTTTTNLESGIIDLGLEYLPFKKSSFNLHAGIGILSKVNVNTVLLYANEVEYGDVTVSQEEIGEINADINWKGVAPYVGIGFGRAIPKKRLGLSLKMGTYFTNAPEVNLTATNLLSNTANQEENLEEALNTFKLIPRIQLKLAYKF